MAKKKNIENSTLPKPNHENRVSVDIKKANNGYVVSSWSNISKRDIMYISKTKKEALKYANRILNSNRG